MQRALIVVDMSNDFIADDGVLTCGSAGQATVQPILQAVQAAYDHGDFIVFACDAHAIDDPEFALWTTHCVVGTYGAKLVADLQMFYENHKGDRVRYLPKTKYDAFFETDLAKWLHEQGIREVIVCGVCTSICCYATASGAYYRGYEVYIDPDLMADLTPEAHQFAIQHMQDVLKVNLL